jgi:signal transduction histidine kinase/ActR/RegA family two-component response regulator
MSAGTLADPGGPVGVHGLARVLLPLSAVIVVLGAGVAAWLAFSSPGGAREPGRTFAVWHTSEAVTAYVRLRRSIAKGYVADGVDEVGLLADTFAQSVARMHEVDQSAAIRNDPAIGTLARRLDAARKQLPALLRQRGEPGTAPEQPAPADDTAELVRLSEAVNQESAILAEQDLNAAEHRRWIASGLMATLAGLGFLLIGVVGRKTSEAGAMRLTIGDTEARLRAALDAVERAGASKSRFIATASHGLRAPMDAVMSLIDSLLEERLPSAHREIAVRIREAGGGLQRALDDVLDYATIEAGDLALDERPFSPEALTAAAVAGIEAQARAKGLTIVAIPSPGLPRLLVGDADRIGRILFRLASNAVKFTTTGGISLQVLCVEREPGKTTIEWIVTDTGIGIDTARLDRLFGAEQPDSSSLGLAVCKRLALRMGGDIAVESTLGEGSRFRLRVPLRLAPSSGTSATQPPSPSASALRERLRTMGRRPRLLMAEATPGGQFILRQLLAREGIAPEIVGDGRAAVIAAERDHYDVICMDLRMPEMNGLDAARRIRSGRGPSARTPIIAVTASTSAEDMLACKDAGMTLFVAKPVRRETLLNAILAALSGEDHDAEPRFAPEARQTAN